jgi:hypothetical protein
MPFGTQKVHTTNHGPSVQPHHIKLLTDPKYNTVHDPLPHTQNLCKLRQHVRYDFLPNFAEKASSGQKTPRRKHTSV